MRGPHFPGAFRCLVGRVCSSFGCNGRYPEGPIPELPGTRRCDEFSRDSYDAVPLWCSGLLVSNPCEWLALRYGRWVVPRRRRLCGRARRIARPAMQRRRSLAERRPAPRRVGSFPRHVRLLMPPLSGRLSVCRPFPSVCRHSCVWPACCRGCPCFVGLCGRKAAVFCCSCRVL